MVLVRWNDTYSVKVQRFDAQHKIILEMINSLAEAMHRCEGAAFVRATYARLVELFRTHFKDEEDLMRRTGYLELTAQQKEHGQYMTRLEDLKTNMEKTGEEDTVTLLFILRDEILLHILKTDKAYSAHFIAKGIR